MSVVGDIRSGLQVRLATVSGLRALAKQPDQVNPPTAFVVPGPIDYDLTAARGGDTYHYTIWVIVGRTSERAAQDLLDTYLSGTGTGSIKTAIEADKTLGGLNVTTKVASASAPQEVTFGDTSYLGAQLEVEVIV